MSEVNKSLVKEAALTTGKIARIYHYSTMVGCAGRRKAVDMVCVEVTHHGVTTVPIRVERALWEVCKKSD